MTDKIKNQQYYKALIWSDELLTLTTKKMPHLFARIFMFIFLGIRWEKNK